MPKGGTKRASPGAEAEKNPLQDVELTPEDAKKLDELSDAQARVELAIGAYGCVNLMNIQRI